MKFIEEGRRFDFCYIDCKHDWDTTGFAFFLVDKILKPGGCLVFDDLDLTYQSQKERKGFADTKETNEEYLRTPQVGKVFDVLVKTHPSYRDFKVLGTWGIARKR